MDRTEGWIRLKWRVDRSEIGGGSDWRVDRTEMEGGSEWNRGWIGLKGGSDWNGGWIELKWWDCWTFFVQTVKETHCGWIGGVWVVGPKLGLWRLTVWCVLLYGVQSQLSLECVCEECVWEASRECEGCNWFENKIKPEMVLRHKRVILWSTRKLISVWPNFLSLPNM